MSRQVEPYTPQAGTIAAAAVRHLAKLTEDQDISSAELAEAIGQPPSCIVPCLEPARRHGLVVATQAETGGPKATLRWRLATEDEKHRALAELDALEEAEQTARREHRQDRAEDRQHTLQRAKLVGVAALNWKPPKPMPPEPEPEEPAPAPAPALAPAAPPERHLAARAWLASTGELVIQAGEHEFLFERPEAQQLVRTLRELKEAWQ